MYRLGKRWLALCVISSIIHTSFGDKFKWRTLSGQKPLLLASAGDQFYVPPNTIPAFKFAAYEGADYIQTDIVLTKDGIPVCFEHLSLRNYTDVSQRPEFSHLMGNYTTLQFGKEVLVEKDWLVVNFTLQELKSLRVKQSQKGVRAPDFNGLFRIPTFLEFIETVHMSAMQLKSGVGILVAMKYGTFHDRVFHDTDHYMERMVLDTLWHYGYPLRPGDQPSCSALDDRVQSAKDMNVTRKPVPCGRVIISSFEKESLKFIHELVTKFNPGLLELSMLVRNNVSLLTPGGFKELASFLEYVGVFKEYAYTGVEAEIKDKGWEYDQVEVTSLGGFLSPQDLISTGHSLGLRIALYEFPDSREDSFWGCAVKCEPKSRKKELDYFMGLGADALYTENLPEAALLRMQFNYEQMLNETCSPLDS